VAHAHAHVLRAFDFGSPLGRLIRAAPGALAKEKIVAINGVLLLGNKENEGSMMGAGLGEKSPERLQCRCHNSMGHQ
jgi:hypothetical protein